MWQFYGIKDSDYFYLVALPVSMVSKLWSLYRLLQFLPPHMDSRQQGGKEGEEMEEYSPPL